VAFQLFACNLPVLLWFEMVVLVLPEDGDGKSMSCSSAHAGQRSTVAAIDGFDEVKGAIGERSVRALGDCVSAEMGASGTDTSERNGIAAHIQSIVTVCF